MLGLGTIVNVVAIIVGGLLGLLFKGGLKERFREVLTQACGLAVIFIGAAGAFEMIFSVEGRSLSSNHTMLIVISLVLGGLVGELINIEKGLDSIGEKLKKLVKAGGDNKFVDGFVTASLVFCVGAMAICGPIDEALTGDSSTLFVKSILDMIMVMVLTSVYGVGAIFSALAVGVYQGLFTVFGVFIADFMTDALILTLSGVGSVLIFAVGLNLLFPKKIRVGNLLPALLVPVVWELVQLIPLPW
ncbi:MAG: DUF554 domain-containing protein [Ruminococcaceae bacterium]|nr:DUF554 domain-containing protein [Oscillospiraceae bacterium]